MPATPQERQTLKQLIKENLRTQNPYLDLGNCGLDGTEPELEMLAECGHLETLVFSNAWEEYDAEKQRHVGHQSQNKGKRNKLIKTPPYLPTSLKELVIAGDWQYRNEWQIEDISFLEGLTQLQVLNLSHNQIEDISSLRLLKIEILDLSFNSIINFLSLPELKDLFFLDFSHTIFKLSIDKLYHLQNKHFKVYNQLENDFNQMYDFGLDELIKQLKAKRSITDLFAESNLTNLQKKNYVEEWLVEKFTSLLSALKKLQYLDLTEIGLEDISFLRYHKKLRVLNLGFNSIKDISHLEKLTNLEELDLGVNRLKNELKALEKLQKLKVLDLSHSYNDHDEIGNIDNINVLKNLGKLTSLDLSYQYIKQFPLDIIQSLPYLKKLYLKGNPIQNIPPDIFDKDGNVLQGVRNYLEDQAKGSARNKAVKIILIGNGYVGKTQIAHRWIKNTFNVQHDSTHGIVRMEKEVADVKLQLWDFAGQDIYHATHRLFMQTSALFFLVWDYENEFINTHHICKEENNKSYKNEKLEYWLEYAQCFGKGSPILVLQNKVDTDEDKDKNYVLADWEAMKAKYPILDNLQVSAQENKGFKVLEHKLKKAFQENSTLHQQLNLTLPNSWIAIRKQIEALQNQGQKMLTFEEFKKLWQEQKMESSVQTLVNYFHNTGLFYYRVGYFDNQIVLNQDWAIQAIYEILNRESEYLEILEDKKGMLEYEDLQEIWATHIDIERALFMDFMLSAELCFETTQDKKRDMPLSQRTFIVPHLLPEAKSKEAVFYQESLHLTHTQPYRFLPTVFIQRFIVKAGKFSQIKLMWRAGLFMQTQQGDALVEADYTEKSIRIFANTQEIMDKIIEELNAISNEGSIKAQASTGKYDDLTAKYLEQMFGLKGLTTKKSQDMNEIIQKALKHLEEANINLYFDEMDKVEMPKSLEPIYEDYKDKFTQDKYTNKFNQQLDIFAKQVNQALSNPNSSPQTPINMPKEQNPQEDSGKIVINFNPTITQTQTVTQTQNNSQSFDFKGFENTLFNFQSMLEVLKEDLERALKKEPENQALKEAVEITEITIENANKVEKVAEKQEEKEIKKAGFWKRLGQFGTWLGTGANKVLSPESIQQIGKSAAQIDILAKGAGIDTGFNFESFGAE